MSGQAQFSDSGNIRTKTPPYLELAATMEDQIRTGQFAPGSRLPAQRELAQKLGLNLSTVARAYRELQHRKLVVGSTRRGTIVTGMSTNWPATVAPSAEGRVIDLTVNRPAVDDFLERLADTLPRLGDDPRFRQLQDYQPPEGASWARMAGQRWIALNGFEPALEDIVVTSGGQHGLFAVMSGFVGAGDVVVADSMTYYGLKALAQMLQFTIVGIGSDDEGLSAAEFEKVCRQHPVKAIFVVPCLQNPTVVTMSADRRAAIVEIARRHKVLIIEDDVYGPMLEKRPPAIVTLAPEITFYIASTSKVLAPGLRVGFLLAPPGRAPVIAEAVRDTAWMPAPLSCLVTTRWIEDGTALRILDAQRDELKARNQLVRDILAGLQFNSDPVCMFIWLFLPPPWRSDDFAANLSARGVRVLPAASFASDRAATEHAVRINLGCARSREELATALRIVADTLAERPKALARSA